MALSSPTNIRETSRDGTDIRLSLRTTSSTAPTLVMTFVPVVYRHFSVVVEQDLTAGTNQGHSLTLEWDDELEGLQRGITYELHMSIQTASDKSPTVDSGITVLRPFPIVTSTNRLSPGFSASSQDIPDIRVSDQIFSTDELAYTGTWHTYPRIVLKGRFNYCKMVNTATGTALEIDAIVASNHVRVIETNPRSGQYGLYGGETLNDLEHLPGDLGDVTDIRNFFIPARNMLTRPAAIEVYFFHRDSNTAVTVSYPDVYYALGDS